MSTRITESVSRNFDISYGTSEQTGDTFTCRVTVIHRGDATDLASYTATGATDAEAQRAARHLALDAIASQDGPLMLPAGPEDEQALAMRLHRQNNFGFNSELVRDDYGTFEGERIYRFTQNGKQEIAVLSLAPHEARQLYDRLAADFGFGK